MGMGRRDGSTSSPTHHLRCNERSICRPAHTEGVAEARDSLFSSDVRRNEFPALIHGTRCLPGHPPSLRPQFYPCPGRNCFFQDCCRPCTGCFLLPMYPDRTLLLLHFL